MKLLMKTAPYLLGALVLFLLGSFIYTSGSKYGASVVQAKWDATKEQDRQKIDDLKQEYDVKEEIHRAENQRINHELAEAKRAYEVALAGQRAEYDGRLLNSENRAGVYQRQAQSGAAESRRLASHAAELDRSLEQSRQLVFELRHTLGLRDRQIMMLADQIKSDRALLNEEGNKDGNGSD